MGRHYGKTPSRISKRTKRGRNIKKALRLKNQNALDSRDQTYLFEDLSQAEAVLDEVMDICPNDIYEKHMTFSENNLNPDSIAGSILEKTYSRNVGVLSEEEYESIKNHPLEIQVLPRKIPNVISGRRIVDIDYYTDTIITLQYNHSQKCTSGKLQLSEEKSLGMGLASKITLMCNMCNKLYVCATVDNNSETSYQINCEAVWASLVSGSIYNQTNEITTSLNIPFLKYKHFSKIEKDLYKTWKEHLWLSMEAAGKEEKRLAIEAGDMDASGTPWITVYVDGGWSKRSYGHNYNATSGVAVIIGQRTGKLLFVGVRNKYCVVCTRAENLNINAHNHVCFKNWTGSSAAMESDILVEGFNKSIEMHGIKYLKFVADGDSSIFCRIQQKVTYGYAVEKIECRNHVVKNLGKALYKIKDDTSINIEGRKLLTQKSIKELQGFVQRMIKVCEGDVEKLKKALGNSVKHVFGHHEFCEQFYCQSKGDVTNTKVNILMCTGVLSYINGAIDNIQSKAYKLISNETNNRAELYMSLVAKFNCGKRLNLTQKHSFQMRSYLAALRYNEGLLWQKQCWKRRVNENIGKYFNRYIDRYTNIRNNRKTVRKRKIKAITERSVDYGVAAVKAELSRTEYNSECQRILTSLQNIIFFSRFCIPGIAGIHSGIYHICMYVFHTVMNFSLDKQ